MILRSPSSLLLAHQLQIHLQPLRCSVQPVCCFNKQKTVNRRGGGIVVVRSYESRQIYHPVFLQHPWHWPPPWWGGNQRKYDVTQLWWRWWQWERSTYVCVFLSLWWHWPNIDISLWDKKWNKFNRMDEFWWISRFQSKIMAVMPGIDKVKPSLGVGPKLPTTGQHVQDQLHHYCHYCHAIGQDQFLKKFSFTKSYLWNWTQLWPLSLLLGNLIISSSSLNFEISGFSCSQPLH